MPEMRPCSPCANVEAGNAANNRARAADRYSFIIPPTVRLRPDASGREGRSTVCGCCDGRVTGVLTKPLDPSARLDPPVLRHHDDTVANAVTVAVGVRDTCLVHQMRAVADPRVL